MIFKVLLFFLSLISGFFIITDNKILIANNKIKRWTNKFQSQGETVKASETADLERTSKLQEREDHDPVKVLSQMQT